MKAYDIYVLCTLMFFFGCNKENNTPLTPPELLTHEVQIISLNVASVSGEITVLGEFDISDHGFVFSKNAEPTFSGLVVSLGPIDTLGIFQAPLAKLDQNTDYYVRAYLKYGIDEILYGDVLSFRTPGPNSWIAKAPYFGEYLEGAVSFVIEDQLFVGTGINDTYVNYFYKYDHQENSWENISSLPSDDRAFGISFAIGQYGYVGLGQNCIGSGLCTPVYFNDLWRYNPLNDSWAPMADFPGDPRSYSSCFVIGEKAYITGGSRVDHYDLWEYDPSTDNWTQKADYPGNCRSRNISFSQNNKGYVGLGFESSSCSNLWEYDPIADSWVEKGNFPGESRFGALGFTFMGKSYVICGVHQELIPEYLTDFWQYDSTNDSWTKIDNNYPGKGRLHMIAAVIDDKILMGLGSNSSGSLPGNRCEDFWEYIPE